MRLTMITDDLTGAADSGSYYVERNQLLKIFADGVFPGNVIPEGNIALNLSTRNDAPEIAYQRHYDACQLIKDLPEQVIFKKIGTGFRGNDSYELEGMLKAMPGSLCFLIDHAPELGTFTLYGNQYCEGEILHKSLYANDPVMPPTKAYIPEILGDYTDISIGLVDIDAVKCGRILEKTRQLVADGVRIVVFDAVTHEDGVRIIETLRAEYPQAFWAGSLGLADALAEVLFGEKIEKIPEKKSPVCACFTATAYPATMRQLEYSKARGLQIVELDVDGGIDADAQYVISEAVKKCVDCARTGNFILKPRVDKYSYKPGTSKKILEFITESARQVCAQIDFERIVVIGGETAQHIYAELGISVLDLWGKREAGVAQGWIVGGPYDGKAFALKGGSVGSETALEKMLDRM